jgi:hypothetical protein
LPHRDAQLDLERKVEKERADAEKRDSAFGHLSKGGLDIKGGYGGTHLKISNRTFESVCPSWRNFGILPAGSIERWFLINNA